MGIRIGNIHIDNDSPLFFIAGPCVIEDEGMVLDVASELKRISEASSIPIIFKASYDKANRTSISSFRGPGIDKGLRILEKVKAETGLLLLADVHHPEEVVKVREILDILRGLAGRPIVWHYNDHLPRPFRESLADTLRWFEENGQLHLPAKIKSGESR